MLTKRHASARDLYGVIDLERLRSGSPASLERDAARFLELTWPSSDVHALVGGLSHRFNGGSQAGTILAHSAKGLGKSHALLLGYHLFSSPGTARRWAGRWSQSLLGTANQVLWLIDLIRSHCGKSEFVFWKLNQHSMHTTNLQKECQSIL